jgi:hypothetical protein
MFRVSVALSNNLQAGSETRGGEWKSRKGAENKTTGTNDGGHFEFAGTQQNTTDQS